MLACAIETVNYTFWIEKGRDKSRERSKTDAVNLVQSALETELNDLQRLTQVETVNI